MEALVRSSYSFSIYLSANVPNRGCVSGAQIQGLRDIAGEGGDEYDFDRIDGYDELK